MLPAFAFSPSSATPALSPGPLQSSQHILGAASEVQPAVGNAQLIGHLYDPWPGLGQQGQTTEVEAGHIRS